MEYQFHRRDAPITLVSSDQVRVLIMSFKLWLVKKIYKKRWLLSLFNNKRVLKTWIGVGVFWVSFNESNGQGETGQGKGTYYTKTFLHWLVDSRKW